MMTRNCFGSWALVSSEQGVDDTCATMAGIAERVAGAGPISPGELSAGGGIFLQRLSWLRQGRKRPGQLFFQRARLAAFTRTKCHLGGNRSRPGTLARGRSSPDVHQRLRG